MSWWPQEPPLSCFHKPREFRCPSCDAPAGLWCKTRGGTRYSGFIHVARKRVAVRATVEAMEDWRRLSVNVDPPDPALSVQHGAEGPGFQTDVSRET